MKEFKRAKEEFVKEQIRKHFKDLVISQILMLVYRLIIAALIIGFMFYSFKSRADGVYGHVEGRGYFMTNTPTHPDLTGDPMKYGVDFELNFPTFIPWLDIMAGADAATGNRQFSQIAGRFGATLSFRAMDLGVYHRSNHAIDATPTNGKFFNDNHVFLRYNFGEKK